jgi:hypothetical protein
MGTMSFTGRLLKRSELHGLPADERPCRTITDRVVIEDLHASIYGAIGLPPKLTYEIEKRPFSITRDGLGTPIPDLFGRLVQRLQHSRDRK